MKENLPLTEAIILMCGRRWDVTKVYKSAHLHSIVSLHSDTFVVLQAKHWIPEATGFYKCIWMSKCHRHKPLTLPCHLNDWWLRRQVDDVLVCITTPFAGRWKWNYLKKGHGGAVPYSAVLYFGLLGQIICRVDWWVHSLHSEEGSQVGSVRGDDDQGKEPPYSTNYPCGERFRHQFGSCKTTQCTLWAGQRNTSPGNDYTLWREEIAVTLLFFRHTTEIRRVMFEGALDQGQLFPAMKTAWWHNSIIIAV